MYSEETKKKTEYLPIILITAAVLIMALSAGLSLRFVPEDAVAMLADVNRMAVFGISDRDPVILLGYFLKKLLGISPAVSLFFIIPLFFYVLFAVLMWNTAGIFFSEDKKEKCLCFFTEACLVFLWNCGSSPAYILFHRLHQTEGIIMTLAVPYIFLLGMRFFLSDKKSTWVISVMRLVLAAVCILAAFLFDRMALGLILLSILAFILLLILRRYLSWLKTSE